MLKLNPKRWKLKVGLSKIVILFCSKPLLFATHNGGEENHPFLFPARFEVAC